MKKKAVKSKVTKPTLESLTKSVSWLRCIEDGGRAFGIGYHNGVLSEVLVKKENCLEPAQIEAEPLSLAESAERLKFVIECERTFGHGSTTDDPAQFRWLSELQAKLAA
jgi:hypothetical protein